MPHACDVDVHVQSSYNQVACVTCSVNIETKQVLCMCCLLLHNVIVLLYAHIHTHAHIHVQNGPSVGWGSNSGSGERHYYRKWYPRRHLFGKTKVWGQPLIINILYCFTKSPLPMPATHYYTLAFFFPVKLQKRVQNNVITVLYNNYNNISSCHIFKYHSP